MRTTQGLNRELLTQYDSSDDPLQAGAIQRLKDEVTKDPKGRGYNSVRWGKPLLRLLNLPVEIPNPEEKKRRQKEFVDTVALQDLNARIVLALGEDPDLREKLAFEVETLLPVLLNAGGRIKAASKQFNSVLGRFAEIGLITQEDIDGLSYTDDPYYKPTILLPVAAEELYGAGAWITMADLKAAGLI